MKKILLFFAIFIIVGGVVVAWMFVGPATAFKSKKETLYIRTNAATKGAILDSLDKNMIVKNTGLFSWLAGRMNYWGMIKPGKYEIEKGSSLLNIVRKLRNGQQTPVNLTINKLRTKEDLAKLVGRRFEVDSTQMINFLNNPDSLKDFDIDTGTSIALILPDTYTYFWNTTPKKIYQKIADATNKFWTAERKQKAQALGLNPTQAYVLASIVEEETNANAEKGNIASVYLNRMESGMPLQADPTVKFAIKDFGLKRIYEKHLLVESPYNTYRNRGLPPGPICTPSKTTIEAVLNAPETNYLYFVASPQFNGTHIFAPSYTEHLKNAKAYQQALNERMAVKKSEAL